MEKLSSDEIFVREPVDDICKKIFKSSAKNIILTGGRGVGKTTVLSSLQNRSLGTENQYISMRFDSAHISSCIEDDNFLPHHYELLFSLKVLNYIKDNYSLIYNIYFKEDHFMILKLLKDSNEYLNKHLYIDVKLDRYFQPGELSAEIINKLRKVLKLKNLNLAIDRFDWTDGVDPVSQKLLSEFFGLFNKTILTSDDENLEKRKNFSIINLDYGKDMETVEEIIRKRIEKYNKGKAEDDQFPFMHDEIYKILIKETNGNINLMLDILKEVTSSWEWDKNDFDFTKEFEIVAKDKTNHFEKVKSMGPLPQFYL